QAGGGRAQVERVPAGNQAGGVPVSPVSSPGYSAATYGAPASPQPTLAAVPSTALASSSFTVKETLTKPPAPPLTGATEALSGPSGWTVTPAGPAAVGTVAPGKSASGTFAVTAPSARLTSGTVNLLATATYGPGKQSLISTAQVQVPASSLAATYDNTGITDDSNPDPSSGFIGYDGEGTSYSAQGLAAAGLTPGGTATAGGHTITWPNVPPAQPDNTMAEGQTITVPGSAASGGSLGVLAAANNSAESGTGTVYYTDGSTSTFTLSVGNFWYDSGPNGNPSNTRLAA